MSRVPGGSRRAILLCLALPAFALSLAGCGLENVPVLTSPGLLSTSGDLFRFQKLLANGDATEPGFLGYDLYYKIYKVGSSPELNIQSVEDLIQIYQFRRLTRYSISGGVLPSPLVAIATADRTASFEINVDFSGDLLDDTQPQIVSIPNTPDTPSSPIALEDIRRGVTYPISSETQRFEHFTNGDLDILDVWTEIEQGNDVLIAAYVVSYGVDTFFGALYSIPLFVGTIQLKLLIGSP